MVRVRVTDSTSTTDASRDLVILAKDRRIKALQENRTLKMQLQTALGKAYDQFRWELSLPPGVFEEIICDRAFFTCFFWH